VNYSALSSEDLVLACLQRGDEQVWNEFIRRLNPVIARSVIRVSTRYGLSDKFLIDDLVQETYLKICAKECKLLRTFTPQHPDAIFGFVKVVAANVAQDFFKSRLAVRRAPEAKADSVEEGAAAASPESAKGTLNTTERSVLLEQIDRKLSAVVPPEELQRARTVFWLYYRSGFTASAIASLPELDLTTKGVESLLLRLTRLMREKLSSVGEPGTHGKKGFQQAQSF
jgi:RNA polymerase sigma-70 factor (ECF subfamily)